MKTKFYLRSAQTIQEKYMAQVANRIIELFVEDIKDEGKHHRVVLIEFKKRLSDFDKEWKARVPKKPLNGRSCKHIMLQTISKFSIHDFIQKKFDFTFHHKKKGFTYMSYSMEKFVELSKMEVAMLLYKYGDDLMAFEIEIAIAELLTNYFELCLHYTHVDQNKWQWCFQPTEFHACVDLLLNMELSEYKQYYNYFTSNFELVQHDRTNEIQYEKRFQPTSKDELKRLYKEGMTQTQFNEAIAFYYNISINTARIWRQKFGLSRHYKNSKANKNNVTSASNE